MSDQRMAEIRNRVGAATPGPWIADVTSDRCHIGPQDGTHDPYDGGLPFTHRPIVENAVKRRYRLEDMEFIAHAREDVPYLLAKVDELERRLSLAGYDGRPEREMPPYQDRL